MTRVLVAEDSHTARTLLVEILRSDASVEVVGEAANGAEAVEMTKQLRPNVVTMDIRMPKLDGFEATRQIMIEAPTPIVIVTGSMDIHEVETSMNALKAGALTLLAKPVGPEAPDFEEQAKRFLDTVKAMAEVKVVRRWPERPRSGAPAATNGPRRGRARVVAIAASTGGPAALARIVADLPGDFGLPLLVVQHIAPGFMEGFAAWLNTAGALRVKLAEHGEPLRPRTVYLAPDDAHLGVSGDGSAISISRSPAVGGFRPSASFLFDSVARAFGAGAVSVVLTGMGQDGVSGLRAIRMAGGRIIAQDEQSSVVFGMPGAAVAERLPDATLPLDAIAFRLRELA